MPTSISLKDVERVKKHAKSLKSDYPHLSHSARLDRAAHELFKARSYHELNKWRETTISSCVTDDGTVAICSFCGLQFARDIRDDLRLHHNRHDAFESAHNALGRLPEQHREREDRKRAGYEILHEGTNTEQRVNGALEVLRAWFDRSLEGAIESGFWKKHPTFEIYVSYMIGELTQFPADVRKVLEDRFGRQDGMIKPGHSYWYPSAH